MEILKCHGFSLKAAKSELRRFSEEGVGMAGLRNKDGRLDVHKKYLEDLHDLLADCERLARGEAPTGGYATKDHISGRIGFVKWINHGHVAKLRRRFRAVDWEAVEREAERLGFVLTLGTA